MSQNTIDLWPSDFGATTERLPVVLLREQAALLGRKTNHLVEAEVTTRQDPELDQDLRHNFYLVAPALDNYRFYLFGVTHNLGSLYPVRFYGKDSEGEFEELLTENQLLTRLAAVFNSDDTRRVIQTLIAQSQTA